MNTETLASAIIGHLVGDYLLQNDWMALNKKAWNGSQQCGVHCLLWTLSVMFFAGWFTTFNHSMAVFAALFWPHYLQDRTNIIPWFMRTIGQRRFMQCDSFDLTDMRVVPGLGPWSIIVVDNVWHIVAIWAVWKFLA